MDKGFHFIKPIQPWLEEHTLHNFILNALQVFIYVWESHLNLSLHLTDLTEIFVVFLSLTNTLL